MSSQSRTDTLMELRKKRVPKGVGNITPFFAESAKGALVTDVEGREFIDFAGGIGVQNLGHCHPKVVAAVQDQAAKLIHTCFHVFMYESYVELADKLCAITPGDFDKKALLVNSGAEAVENAVKIARHATGRQGIIAFENGFHGRTLMGMSLTSKVKPYKLGFGPFAPEIYRMHYPYCYRCPLGLEHPSCDIACVEKLNDFFINYAAAESIACLLIEPIAGEGGFIVPPAEYFPRLAEICKDNGIVFIADEIQSGFCRTGSLFAIEHWGVTPDLITMAKSMGAGVPISAVVGRTKLMDAPQPGGLGGTYGGNPLACRSALAVIDVIEEEDIQAKSDMLGEDLRRRFNALAEEYPIIGDVRGLGPMLAMELVTDPKTKAPATEQAKALSAYCQEHGLVILTCGNYGNVIRTLMPIVITEEQLERGMDILSDGLKAVS